MPILYESYGKSPEVSVGARKLPTSIKLYLGPSPMGPGVSPYPPGKVLVVGTRITTRAGIFSTEEGKWLKTLGVPVNFYHRLNTGAWERHRIVAWDTEDTHDYDYVLNKAGTHTFYIEWAGTDKYEGCSKAVRLFAR